MSVPICWPFGTEAFVVWRPCGCCWKREGMGIVVAPCAAHAEPMAAAVRIEDSEAVKGVPAPAPPRTELDEIIFRVLGQTMRVVGPERFSPERMHQMDDFLRDLFCGAWGFGPLPAVPRG